MKKRKIAVLLMVACLGFASLGYGETVQGEVANLGTDEFSLKMNAETDSQGAAVVKQILVSPETQFEGAGMEELRIGDEVLVEVFANEGGVLQAQKVRLDKVSIRN